MGMIILLIAALFAGAPPAESKPRAPDDTDKAALREFVGTVVRANGIDRANPLPGDAPDEVRRWVAKNRPALAGARHTDALQQQPWGLFAWGPAERAEALSPLYLYAFDWHASGKLVVYGLTGGVEKAYLLADPARTPLPSVRSGNSTVYSVPKDAPDPLATVVVLELNGELQTTDLATRPAPDGRIVLHARDAVVHGRVVRYEPEPHKNTIGYWSDPKDTVSWDFEVTESGEYRVEILQGCGKGSGGSKVDFAVGTQVLSVTVRDTGGFQNFITRDIGRLRFENPGRYTLTVTPQHKAGVAVMDLREVTLTRVKE